MQGDLIPCILACHVNADREMKLSAGFLIFQGLQIPHIFLHFSFERFGPDFSNIEDCTGLSHAQIFVSILTFVRCFVTGMEIIEKRRIDVSTMLLLV